MSTCSGNGLVAEIHSSERRCGAQRGLTRLGLTSSLTRRTATLRIQHLEHVFVSLTGDCHRRTCYATLPMFLLKVHGLRVTAKMSRASYEGFLHASTRLPEQGEGPHQSQALTSHSSSATKSMLQGSSRLGNVLTSSLSDQSR
jgi:hypothetical protein